MLSQSFSRAFRPRRASREPVRRSQTVEGTLESGFVVKPPDEQRRHHSDHQIYTSADNRKAESWKQDVKDSSLESKPLELLPTSDRLPLLQLPIGPRPDTANKVETAMTPMCSPRRRRQSELDPYSSNSSWMPTTPRPPTQAKAVPGVPRSGVTTTGTKKGETYIVPMPTQVPRRASEVWPDQITAVSEVKFSSQPPPQPPPAPRVTQSEAPDLPCLSSNDPGPISLCDLIASSTDSIDLRTDLLETIQTFVEKVRVEFEAGMIDVDRLFTPQLGPALLEEMQQRCVLLNKPLPSEPGSPIVRKGYSSSKSVSPVGTYRSASGRNDNLSASRIVRFMCSGRVYDGMSMEGPEVAHMDRGNFFFKKGVKPYWRMIAVDTKEVNNYEELRAAVDVRRKLNGRSFKVSFEADEESARLHHEWQRKVLMKTLGSLKKSDEVDLFFLEQERHAVMRNKEVVFNLIHGNRVTEMEVLLGNATAAEMESFLELVACLKADLSEEVRRIVAQQCGKLALRDQDASTIIHHARSRNCLEMVLKIAPPGLAHKRNLLGQTGAQASTANSPDLADSFIDYDICSLLAIDYQDGHCGAMHLEGKSREAFESAFPEWSAWSAALQARPDVLLEALEVPASRVLEMSKEAGDKIELAHRCIVEPIHYFCFGEKNVWEKGTHTAQSSSRLREVAAAVQSLFAGLLEEPKLAEPLKVLLKATKGPRKDILDPRAPWRDDLELAVAAYENKVQALLAAEYKKVCTLESSAWIISLEDQLLVPGFRLRMDSYLDGCPVWKHPEWVWEQDFDAALQDLNDLGVFSSPTAVNKFTQQASCVGSGLQGLDRRELTFMRLHAIQRREICQVHVNDIRDWFAAWAGQHDCTFSARKTAKQVERILAKASLTADEVVASCSHVPKRDLQTAADYVSDINGVEIVAEDMASLGKIYAAIVDLRWRKDGAQLMRVKNLFHSGADVTETGYRDLKVWLLVNIERIPLVVELQLHLQAFYKLKKGMHVAYEYRRGSFDHAHVQPVCPARSRRLLELREATQMLESSEVSAFATTGTTGLEQAAQKLRDVIHGITEDSESTNGQVREEVTKATSLLAMLDSKIGAQQELDHTMTRLKESEGSAAERHRLLAAALEKAGTCGLHCEEAAVRLGELEEAWSNETRMNLASERPAALKAALNDAKLLGIGGEEVNCALARREEMIPLEASLNAKLMNSLHQPEEIRKLIWDSADPSYLNERGGSALLLAIKGTNVSSVEVLLECRADPNQGGKYGNNAPLHAVSRLANNSNASTMVELLLNSSAEVNLENEDGWRPIHCAVMQKAENDSYEVFLNLLLRSKASINKRLPDAKHERHGGASVLHLAVDAGNHQAVSLLLKNKAKVNASQSSGHTPLWLAVSHGDAKMTEHLLGSDADVTKVDHASNTLLHQVALSGHMALIDMLVIAKANINSCNDKGQTPLAIARSHGAEKIAVTRIIDELERLGAHL